VKRTFPKISSEETATQRGFDVFKAKSEQICSELEDWYYTIKDVISLNEKTLAVLLGFARNLSCLEECNYHLMVLFFELLGLYVKLQIAMQGVPNKVQNIAAFVLAYQQVQGKTDENVETVTRYMTEMMGPQGKTSIEDRLWVTVTSLRLKCEPLSQGVRASTKFLWTSIQRWAPASSFEKQRMFSILVDASKIVQPARTAKYLELEYLNGFREWVQYALLVCPSALQEPEARYCLNKIIYNSFTIPVVREVTFDFAKIWDKTFREYKCGHISQGTKFYLKQHRDAIFKEAYVRANECAMNHRSLRRYLQGQLNQYVCLFTEIPGLAGPKFQLILSLIKLASDEIHWYFHHTDAVPFKEHKINWIPNLAQDPTIIKLMGSCVDLVHLVTKFASVVKDYFVEYIRDVDAPKCEKELKKLFNTHGKKISKIQHETMTNLLREARSITPQTNFTTVKLDFFRTMSFLSSAGSGIPFQDAKPILAVFTEMYTHFTNVLRTEQRLIKNANIGSMIWYTNDIKQVAQWTVTRPKLYGQCMTLLQILGHVKFDLNLKFCPDEQSFVMKTTTAYAERVMTQVCKSILVNFDRSINRAMHLAEVGGLKSQIQKIEQIVSKKGKKNLDHGVAQIPGTESKHGSSEYAMVQAEAQRLGQLLSAVRSVKQVQVFKLVINPYDWLFETLDYHVSGKIEGLFADDVRGVCRPTVALAKLKALQRALTFVEQHIPLNSSDMIRGNILKHYTKISAGTIRDGMKMDSKSQASIQKIARFYWDLINKSNVTFSPLNMQFVTVLAGRKSRGEMHADNYTTQPELKALCQIVGPYGVKAIQSVFLTNLGNSVHEMKRIVAANSVYLGQLDFVDIKSWATNVAKVTEKDEFLTAAIQVGRCLQFISILKRAQRAVQDGSIPFVSQVVDLVTQRLENDTKIEPGKQLCSVLTDSGVHDPVYDMGMKEVFQRVFSSGVVLSHIPKMFACLFAAPLWKNSKFQPEIEGFSNGADSVITSIQMILPAICKSREETMTMLQDFVVLSAYALLHMNSRVEAKDREYRDFHIPSMMIFMSKFMESCKNMSLHVLEECLPFTLMRTKIIEIYERLKLETDEKSTGA